MRTIKFRAKVKQPEGRRICRLREIPEGEWVYGEIHTIDCLTPHIHAVGVGKQPIDRETICQFTGLYDRDKKEIYEGDIVDLDYILYDPWDDAKEILEPMRCVVVYEDFEFRFQQEEDLYYFLHDVTNIKVIGNIHDNPELLKGGKDVL